VVGHHLLAPGGDARHAQRVLVRLGSPQGEEEPIQIARRHLGQQLAQSPTHLGRELRRGERQLVSLFGDGVRDSLVAMADVDAHQLAVEVEVGLPVGVPEVDPFGPIDDDRVDLRLGRPGEEGVLPIEAQDLVGGEPSGGGDGHRYLERKGAA